MKTLAIRLADDEHARLAALAQLRGTNLVDELRDAVSEHLRSKIGEADLAAQAQVALEEIEREAQSRRQAIEALLGPPGDAPSSARRQRSANSAGNEAK